MIKLSFCLTKRDDLSIDEFYDYWLNNHAPLVKKLSNDLKIVRYIQLHSRKYDFLEESKNSRIMNNNPPKEYNGIAEIYWDSWEDFKDLSKTKKARKAGKMLLEDEAKFIKFSESPMIFSEIHEII